MWNKTTRVSNPEHQQSSQQASRINSAWRSTWRSTWLFLLMSCLLLTLSPAALTAQQTIPFDQYLALISRSQENAQAVANAGGSACTDALNEIAQALSGVTHVRLPDGSTMQVNHDGVFAVLQASPCNINGMATYLTGICPVHLCTINRAPSDQAAESAPTVPSTSDVSPNNSSAESVPPSSLNPVDAANPFGNTLPATSDENGNMPLPAQPEQAPQVNEGGLVDAANSGEAADTAVSPQPNDGADNTAVSPPDEPASTDAAEAGENGTETEPGAEAGELPADGNQPGEGDTAVPEAAAGETQPGSESEASDETSPPADQTDAADAPAESNTDPSGGDTAVAPPDVPNPEEDTGDESIPPEPERPEPNQTLLIGIAITLIFFIIVLVVLFIRLKRAEDAARQQKKKQPSTSAEAVTAGRQKIDEGDYREAVRQLFLATLLTLEERGIMQFDKTLTNQELLTKMQNKQPILDTLLPVVSTVERVWYGFEALAAAEYDALVHQIDMLKQGG